MRKKNLSEAEDKWIEIVNRKEEKLRYEMNDINEIYELMCDMKTT